MHVALDFPPKTHGSWCTISLLLNSVKRVLGKAFVSKSVNWYAEEQYSITSCFLKTFSCIKYMSISTCLKCWCWTGFYAIHFVLILTQYTSGGYFNRTFNSYKREVIHFNFAENDASARYSRYFVSTEDLETTLCFVENHEIKLSPRKIQYAGPYTYSIIWAYNSICIREPYQF